MIGPSTRKILQDRHLSFNCFQFSWGEMLCARAKQATQEERCHYAFNVWISLGLGFFVLSIVSGGIQQWKSEEDWKTRLMPDILQSTNDHVDPFRA